MRTFLGGIALIAVAIFEAGATSDGAPASAPAGQASVAAAPAPSGGGDARIGKATFTQECSICHGAGGKGFIGPHIGGIDWTAPGLKAIVRGGLGGYGGMPAFNAAVVTDRNIADIAAYLASLAPATVSQASATATPAPPSPTARSTQFAAVSAPPAAAPPPTAAAVPSATAAAAGGSPVHGHQIYSANCAACHGASGQGGFGPSLHGESARKDDAAAIAWIKNPKAPMPKLYPDPLSEKDVEDVAAYIESL